MIFLKKEEFKNYLKKDGALIGIDYGSKHIGIAMTDLKRKFSVQLEPLVFSLNEEDDLFQFLDEEINNFKANQEDLEFFLSKWMQLFLQIEKIIFEKRIIGCVIGLPLKKNFLTENIQQHIELFAMALDLFFLKKSIEKADFQKLQEEMEFLNLNIEINEENFIENSILRNKLNSFPIFLQDERYSSKKVLGDINALGYEFESHYNQNKNFNKKCISFDEENEKFFKNKKTKKISKMKNFNKFKKDLFLKVKNSAAAVNILNSAIEE